ncbi:hypothetical protein C2E23DRAFT_341868 [Lenzites betulinus]|nr:hypothetical protein C2E23DRAFT_341868 [Lenzites betulinus]
MLPHLCFTLPGPEDIHSRAPDSAATSTTSRAPSAPSSRACSRRTRPQTSSRATRPAYAGSSSTSCTGSSTSRPRTGPPSHARERPSPRPRQERACTMDKLPPTTTLSPRTPPPACACACPAARCPAPPYIPARRRAQPFRPAHPLLRATALLYHPNSSRWAALPPPPPPPTNLNVSIDPSQCPRGHPDALARASTPEVPPAGARTPARAPSQPALGHGRAGAPLAFDSNFYRTSLRRNRVSRPSRPPGSGSCLARDKRHHHRRRRRRLCPLSLSLNFCRTPHYTRTYYLATADVACNRPVSSSESSHTPFPHPIVQSIRAQLAISNLFATSQPANSVYLRIRYLPTAPPSPSLVVLIHTQFTAYNSQCEPTQYAHALSLSPFFKFFHTNSAPPRRAAIALYALLQFTLYNFTLYNRNCIPK